MVIPQAEMGDTLGLGGQCEFKTNLAGDIVA